jgi:hypothetical protein
LLELTLLHDAFVVLACVLDAVLVLAIGAVRELTHHLVRSVGGVAIGKPAAESDPLPRLV